MGSYRLLYNIILIHNNIVYGFLYIFNKRKFKIFLLDFLVFIAILCMPKFLFFQKTIGYKQLKFLKINYYFIFSMLVT